MKKVKEWRELMMSQGGQKTIKILIHEKQVTILRLENFFVIFFKF